MTNREFVNFVAARNRMYRDDALKVIQVVWDGIREAIATGESLYIPGIGTIYPDFVEAKEWKNPFNGETKYLDERVRLRFRPSKKMQVRLTESLLGGDIDAEVEG